MLTAEQKEQAYLRDNELSFDGNISDIEYLKAYFTDMFKDIDVAGKDIIVTTNS